MCAEIVDVMLAASRCAGLRANPRVKGFFDVVELAQFGLGETSNAVLRYQSLQFIARVDAPFFRAGRYQGGFGLLVLAEEEDLAVEGLRTHHDEGQPEQGEEMLFKEADEIGKLRRALREDVQVVPVHFDFIPAPGGN
jgi:hypothetical protein